MSEFEIRRDGDKLGVVLQGDLTASVVPVLKPALLSALEEGGTEVEFDFDKTVVIDSTGIGFLIATYNSLQKKTGTVRIVQASNDIFRLLQSMRLEKRLSVATR
ncbi:MAG: STAS domain-containing protein [Syntrophobacteraceae bacterium]